MPVRNCEHSHASTPRSVFRTARRALAACAAAVLLSLPAPFGAVAVHAETPRLLTGLSAEASPDGVVLSWTAHGPRAGEIAGRLRLWTPLPAGTDPAADWPSRAVLVAGFGALREDR